MLNLDHINSIVAIVTGTITLLMQLLHIYLLLCNKYEQMVHNERIIEHLTNCSTVNQKDISEVKYLINSQTLSQNHSDLRTPPESPSTSLVEERILNL